jgi:hypothetical protein
MALKERIQAQEREATARAEMQRQRFEQRFNKLVDAVAAFAKEYNEGKGQVWPSAEAAKLRKAMSELQALEESLGGKSPRTPTCATSPR